MTARALKRSNGWASAVWGIVAALVFVAVLSGTAEAQSNPNVRPPAGAVEQAVPGAPAPGAQAPNAPSGIGVPANSVGPYDVEMWRKVRGSVEGTVSIPDKKSGRLIDMSGETWRLTRNGPLPIYGAYLLGGMVALLALFFLVRGRIKIDHGFAGTTITRFNDIERAAHWLLAVSFLILALTGLNITYGRTVLMPMIGKEAFASLSLLGKYAHNYVAFAFMAGLLLTFVLWVRHNMPHPRDLYWLLVGGGMFVKGVHPPAKKFNAGQKILFWLIVLGGISISLSGLALLYPYQMPLFAKTFTWINALGFSLPTELTANQEQQLASLWHAIVAVVLTAVIIGHIYIGTLGMEGAFAAMGSGQVDLNWAKEHHSLWVEDVLEAERTRGAGADGGRVQPAE